MRKQITLLAICLLVVSIAKGQSDSSIQIDRLEPMTRDNIADIGQLTTIDAEAGISDIAFNADSTLMAYLTTTSLNLWDIPTQTLRWSVPIEKRGAITFSPDGSLFAEVSEAGEIYIYANQSLELRSSIPIAKDEPVLNLAIDPNNRYLAVATGAPEIVTTAESVFQLFDIESGKELFALKRDTADIDEIFGTGTVFDDKGKYVFLSTSDGIVRRWDLETQAPEIVGEEAARGIRILGTSKSYQAIYLNQNGGIRTIDWDGNIRDIATEQHKDARYFLASAIAIHPKQPIVAISYIMPSSRTDKPATRDSILQLWNLDSGEMLFEMPVSEPGMNRLITLAFSPDGTLLASGGTDGTVRLWGVPAT